MRTNGEKTVPVQWCGEGGKEGWDGMGWDKRMKVYSEQTQTQKQKQKKER